ncbi:hypothetical protein HYFRA_00005602 [Hymenoscyphus fraxineus]|uniref:Uncharacterized protein n=1 Tax=Hymenoscyphus fraxineus TaxID=746836 RepID=A0A9N9KRR7_9HELO|nr:hypothetical protein HYFRA_00005602 [Hymenoscyphus fraxineus]
MPIQELRREGTKVRGFVSTNLPLAGLGETDHALYCQDQTTRKKAMATGYEQVWLHMNLVIFISLGTGTQYSARDRHKKQMAVGFLDESDSGVQRTIQSQLRPLNEPVDNTLFEQKLLFEVILEYST